MSHYGADAEATKLPSGGREPQLIVLAPLYSLLHVVILTPLRLVALATLLDTRWGTREAE